MTTSADLQHRLQDRISTWRVLVEDIAETDNSILAFGHRGDQQVVIKVIRRPGEEWLSGAVLDAFEGKGVVRVFDFVDGAVLLERLIPGTSLESIAVNGRDERATEILADVISRMSPRASTAGLPTVEQWGLAFDRLPASATGQIPGTLFDEARHVYSDLCASQSRTRLLHGDLHYDNVLLDSSRGWLAIDPKGVIGEPEYEPGAALRNPLTSPELFLLPSTIEARVTRLCDALPLDPERTLAWAFAQSVLAVIWAIEDGVVPGRNDPWIHLAETIRPMIARRIGPHRVPSPGRESERDPG